MKMFCPKADLFFEDPRSDHRSPDYFGVLYLLRRDIHRCFGWDPVKDKKTGYQTLWPGAMAIFAGIDLLAKFHKGDDTLGGVSARFRGFIKEYFKPISPIDAETIYQLRNALLHSFGLYSCKKTKNGTTRKYRFLLTNDGARLVQEIPPDWCQIDLKTLHKQFEESIRNYAADLDKDKPPGLQKNFLNMFPNYGSVSSGMMQKKRPQESI